MPYFTSRPIGEDECPMSVRTARCAQPGASYPRELGRRRGGTTCPHDEPLFGILARPMFAEAGPAASSHGKYLDQPHQPGASQPLMFGL
jgi:hypothetical protein